MEWQQIVGFYHVARLRSFSKAGELTLRTQSAVSQQIKALENEFGCRLFERMGPRKVKLTSAGERFFAFSEAVLKDYWELARELNELKGVPQGPLMIAAPFTTLYHLLPVKLQAYVDRFPKVELTLTDCPQARVVELVRDGEADFGLVLESAVPADLLSMRWKKVETVLMVPEGHPLALVKHVKWKQISRYPLILPPKDQRSTGRIVLEDQLQKLGLKYRIAMESSNVELSSLYVETGLGISLATVVRDLPALKQRKLEFLPMDHYFKPDHLALVMRKDSALPHYKKAFIDMLLGAV